MRSSSMLRSLIHVRAANVSTLKRFLASRRDGKALTSSERRKAGKEASRPIALALCHCHDAESVFSIELLRERINLD